MSSKHRVKEPSKDTSNAVSQASQKTTFSLVLEKGLFDQKKQFFDFLRFFDQ